MKSFVDSRLIGGILLIIGTSIGGGMLALPVSTAMTGFLDASIFLILSWFVMTMGALLILEVNLYLPSGSNIISMASKTLGNTGKSVAWFCYLLLLYSLLSAYISGGSDVMHNLLSIIHIKLPIALTTALFTFSLGSIIYIGIRIVDYCNRGLMAAKLGILLLLIIFIAPHIQLEKLKGGELKYISSSIMILITSFGFASIVPSLRSYFESDVMKLRKAILIGSLIPLACYLIWEAVIMGVVSKERFAYILDSSHTTSELTIQLSAATKSIWITDFFRGFAAICMLTAFLGVSLGLFDFLADGLNLQKRGKQGYLLFCVTFVPPLILVLFYPNAYLNALSFAGILCVTLLLLLPTLMAYRGRYHLHLNAIYQVAGGKLTLFIAFIASISLLTIAFSQL